MVSRAAVAAREAFAMHGSLHESVVEEVSAHENHRTRSVQTRNESVFSQNEFRLHAVRLSGGIVR